MQNLVGEKQMTLDMKKQSSPKQIRVLDEQDQVWSSIKNLTAGMSAEQRSQFLMKLVDSMEKSSPSKGE